MLQVEAQSIKKIHVEAEAGLMKLSNITSGSWILGKICVSVEAELIHVSRSCIGDTMRSKQKLDR